MLSLLTAIVHDEEGATMVEYGVMLALICAVSVGIVTALGLKVLGAFTTVNTALP
jgi:pilus assembly protein Flp/PilA